MVPDTNPNRKENGLGTQMHCYNYNYVADSLEVVKI